MICDPPNPRLTTGIFGKYLARSHNLILELPMNTIPRAKAASRDLVVRTPPSRSPTIGRGTDGACINNGRTVPGEKGNDSTGACDGQSEPDDAPKRPAKPILLPH